MKAAPERAPSLFSTVLVMSMDPDASDLRQRLAEVDERIDRIGKRFTAGYGSDADRDGWLAWLRELEARRAAILTALTEVDAGRE
jgi:hypothetical protein